MKVNEFFDKVYCINLPERTDRWQQCEAEFKKHNIEVQRFEGRRAAPINRINGGYIGLALTTINMLKEAKSKGYKNILLLEDDVYFIDDFNQRFEAKIKFLPENWELIHLGGNNHFHMGKFECISKNIDFELNRLNYKQLDHEICTTRWTQTAHAMGINSSVYDVLINELSKFDIENDMVYCRLQLSGKHNTYAFIPSIALQRPSFSNLQGGFVNYNNNPAHFF